MHHDNEQQVQYHFSYIGNLWNISNNFIEIFLTTDAFVENYMSEDFRMAFIGESNS